MLQMPITNSDPDTIPPYKPGTIKSIKLVNFMCHSSFELTLGPRVNFIIGPNGSGKSALLTALVVALGGRATITSRAKKTSDFVMYGKRNARISVVIQNYEKIMDKDQAFKPDDYGKFITVERNIYKEEASKLILKNDKDKKVSERKQELDDLLEHFGILINNPICILNQEVSKTFLHSKKPEDKFDLFMKATNLEQIEQDYDSAQQSRKEWEDINCRKTVAFRLLDAEYNSCKEKTGFLENRAKMNDTRENLNRELIWAITRDNEVSNEELNKKVQEINKNIADAKKDIDSRESKIKNYEEDVQVMKTKIQSINEQIEETRKKMQDIRSKETGVKTKQVEVRQKIEQCRKKINRYNDDKASLEKSIADMKKQFRDQNALDQDNEQRKLEIERLERELPTDHAREKSIRLHTDQLSTSMTSIRSELSAANMRVNALQRNLSISQASLRRLKNGQDNELRKYGDFVIKIREEIDKAFNQGRFKRKPVGPLGYYLKLRSPDVADPLEAQLGRNAHAFACDNRQDMTTLTSIFKRLEMNCRDFRTPIIITRPFSRKHDISRFKADHDNYKTLLDYLDIEDEAVYNAIVDRTFLESVLYIPNYSDAELLMLTPAMVPKNTRCAYTQDCSVMYPKTANGGYRSFANNGRKYHLFSKSNVAQIKEVEKEIQLFEAELRDAENIVKGIQDSLNAQRSEYDRNNKEIRRLIDEVRKKEEQLLNLKTTITVEPQELSALESELDNNQTMIATEKLNIERHEEILVSHDKDLIDIMKEKEECQSILKIRENKRQSVHKIVEDTKNSISEAQTVIKQKLVILENRNLDKVEQSKKLEDSLEKLVRSKQNIPEDFVRPNIIRNTAEVKEEIRKIDVQLRVEEEEMRDPEELMESLNKRMKEIESLTGLKDSNLKNFSTASKTLDQRKEGFASLRAVTTSAVSTTFSTVMRSMRMNGELQIHLDDVVHRGEVVKKAKTLEMRIDTNYTPSQRVSLVMSDSNSNNNSGSQTERRISRSQPANLAQPRAKRPRLDPGDNSNSIANEKENEVKMTDARSLSGGERSFSTVAFVLALWHHCASPFKLMDEIDVFMDMVTRRVSYNALIRFAQLTEDPGQFIFFSPLELPKIDNSASLVRVFEMPAIIRKRPHSQIVEAATENV